jgi:tetratricopeptide (TPR) repeat protein
MNLNSLDKQASDYLEQENYSDAIALYEQCIEAEPQVTSHYWNLGLSLLLKGQEMEAQTTWLYILAQANLEQIEVWTDELIKLLEAKAQHYYQIDKFSQTVKIYRQILELRPEYSERLEVSERSILSSLKKEAQHLHDLGQLADAEQKYKEILQLDDTQEDVWFALGLISYLTQRYPSCVTFRIQGVIKKPG